MHARRISAAAAFISAIKPTASFLAPSTSSLSRSVFVPSAASPSSLCCYSTGPTKPASSAANQSPQGSSTETTKMADCSTGPILEPQGNHYPWDSMAPLTEAGEFAKSRGLYFKKCKEVGGGGTVYKIHPGLAMIAITDYASAKWFFEQPDTVLDRQDGACFGSFACSKYYIGESLPALISNTKESHAEVRAYMIEVLKERVAGTQKALTHATDNFYANLKENGLGEYPTVHDTFLRLSHAVILEWALGTGEEGGQPLPPFKDFLNVNPADLSLALSLEIDTPTANAAAQALQKAKGVPTQEQKASVEVLLESIRSSKAWPRFAEVLEKNQVPLADLDRAFMFATGFQSSSPIAKSMECVIGALNENLDFVKELQDELDGQELTMEAVNDVCRFPLLDSLHWEILRMSPAPDFHCKVAKMDVVVPTSNGDRYQIRKGDTVMCVHTLAQIDELKFGPDARVFNPKRFVGNQALKKDIFAYAYPVSTDVTPKDGMPWGCVAHAIGIIDSLLLVTYGRWVQEYTWEMTEPTVLDPDLFLGRAGPVGMAFSKLTPRK